MSGKGFGEYLTEHYRSTGRRRTDAEAADEQAKRDGDEHTRKQSEEWKPGEHGYERGFGRYLK
ncbi:hypothetical protein [Nocardia nova]|uniref:hypothetical protein n=1 Tax=Nocardia nova TaxID=37330 RepID=UPI000CEA42D5|nr:hypothetical protein [Nocardia nova]PPJ34405.1 hypothetical protein C5E41_02325 [Nocardia nova]